MKIYTQTKVNRDTLRKVDALAVTVRVDASGKADMGKGASTHLLDKAGQDAVKAFLVVNKYKVGDMKTVFVPGGSVKNIILHFVDAQKWDMRRLRISVRRITNTAKQNRFANLGLFLADCMVEGMDAEVVAKTIAENALLAQFDFAEVHKTKPKDGWAEVKTVTVFADADTAKAVTRGVATGTVIGEEANNTRLLSNSPAGIMTPETLAQSAITAGKRAGFSVEVFNEKKMETLGMGGILGVGQGSTAKPRLIIMEYLGGAKEEKPIAFVGKGVTFDTGGINIKSTDGVKDMHLDMSGGAAVIGALSAIARLKLPINVYGFVPAAENMVSGESYRPGDILKTYSGKTIEVLNTDAEGRIILADAISYAKTKNPELIFDVATLTGAAVVALGERASATFTKDDSLSKFLSEVAEKSGDYVWPLPMWDEYEEDVRGTFGDVANTGKNRYGGATNGAMFLWQFAKPNLWAHLDIAPTMTSIPSDALAKGATGTGVRMMVEIAKNWKQFKK